MIKINKTLIIDSERYLTGKYKGVQKWKKYQLDANKHYASVSAIAYNFGSGYEVFRQELLNDQGPKCCYCEKGIENGEIEHYRPKGTCQQARGGAKINPGYYFLVYRWKNLLISCGECNASGQKGILFPINGPSRATCLTELDQEDPVIINPAFDAPEDHITFNEDIPVRITDRGQENIDIFKLTDRGDIANSRRDRFMLYKREKQLLNLGLLTGVEEVEAKRIIKNATKDKHPFSGMIRANLKKGIL